MLAKILVYMTFEGKYQKDVYQMSQPLPEDFSNNFLSLLLFK